MMRFGLNAEFISQAAASHSLTRRSKGLYDNAFRFDSQLYDFRFDSSCCTNIHTFLFIFSVLLYVWALGLAVRLRG